MSAFLLRDADGCYRRADGSTRPAADDASIWLAQPGALVNAATGLRLDTERPARVGHAVALADVPASYVAQAAPTRLPSDYRGELREHGFTVLDNVLDESAALRIKDAVRERLADEQAHDGRLPVPGAISWSVDVAKAVTHPVALWLIRSYLATDEIHFCHPPSLTCMRPAKDLLGTFPELGWHSDYPYHPGVLERERWDDELPLGVQYNVCVDEFRPDNAATQFLPGSFALRQWPSEAFNSGGTRMGEGVHEDVRQMTAPSGAALIYDSRMWHRACDELNTSGADRVAILNAVTPAWVLPMSDKHEAAAAYLVPVRKLAIQASFLRRYGEPSSPSLPNPLPFAARCSAKRGVCRGIHAPGASDVVGQLNARERDDLNRLCCTEQQSPPPDAPLIKRREKSL